MPESIAARIAQKRDLLLTQGVLPATVYLGIMEWGELDALRVADIVTMPNDLAGLPPRRLIFMGLICYPVVLVRYLSVEGPGSSTIETLVADRDKWESECIELRERLRETEWALGESQQAVGTLSARLLDVDGLRRDLLTHDDDEA